MSRTTQTLINSSFSDSWSISVEFAAKHSLSSNGLIRSRLRSFESVIDPSWAARRRRYQRSTMYQYRRNRYRNFRVSSIDGINKVSRSCSMHRAFIHSEYLIEIWGDIDLRLASSLVIMRLQISSESATLKQILFSFRGPIISYTISTIILARMCTNGRLIAWLEPRPLLFGGKNIPIPNFSLRRNLFLS